MEKLHEMAKIGYPGIQPTLLQNPLAMSCSGCAKGRWRDQNSSKKDYPRPGASIASDTFPWDIKYNNRYRNFVKLLDGSTRCLLFHLLTRQNQVKMHKNSNFPNMMWRTGIPISQIRSVNAKEYKYLDLEKLYRTHSINLEPISPHASQENSQEKCMNQILIDRTCSSSSRNNLSPMTTDPHKNHFAILIIKIR